MTRRPDPAETVRTVLHELRSRVGAIRLAVTTLQTNTSDEELMKSLLATADRETLRVSMEMVAVTALVTCLTDRSAPRSFDIGHALRNAVTLTERVGGRATLGRGSKAIVRARPRGFESALSSLMQLVADVDGETIVSVSTKNGAVTVKLARPDGSHAPGGSLVKNLLAGIGATQIPSDAGLVFRLEGVSP
ncbi:MAG: hypothetical protein ABR548_11700 [Actinomycetota bacterium]|nr:hypothetical protein [Actinomycetota bacterium]